MPVTFADRVKETTTTTGTGSVTLAGAASGFRTFSSGIGVGNKVYYMVVGTSEWEIGEGTLSNATTLTRDSVLASSNSNSLVNFSAGTKTVLATVPAAFVSAARAAKDVLVTAGEAITIRDCIYFSQADGKAYRIKADVLASGNRSFMIGFAVEGAAISTTFLARIAGSLDGFPALTNGRIQYASDTAGTITETPPINLLPVGVALPVNDSAQTGFVAGGGTNSGSGRVTTADKITFATDTTAAKASANLSQARSDLAGASNGLTHGYFSGGLSGGSGPVATSDKITFSNDTTAAKTSANLSQARTGVAACSDSSTKCYFAGGDSTGGTGTDVTTADKIVFATDTASAQASANLSQARQLLAGVSGRISGYFAGGVSSLTRVVTADKVTFATDTTAAQTSANLSQARSSLGGCSEHYSKGYFAGGTSGGGSNFANANKVTFSNDTTAAQTSANLSQARYGVSGCSAGSVKGYFAGGNTGADVATTDKTTFATDTTAAQASANLSQARYGTGAVENNRGSAVFINTQGFQRLAYFSGTKGFCGGGQSTTTPTRVATTDKTTFSNDTTAAQTTANLSQARDMLVGLTAFNNKGYFVGGTTSAVVATADLLNFSVEVTTAKTTANLSQARREMGAVSERASKGYIAGGFTSAVVATANKISFPTDISSAVSVANLSQARGAVAGLTEGYFKGYFLGGYTSTATEVTTGNIIMFANDTTSARTTANTPAARSHMACFSKGKDEGFACGGQSGSAVAVNTIYRMVYSTDTLSLITPTLSAGRWGSGSFSEGYAKAYVLGGRSSAELATTDVFKFGPKTATATASANLSTVRSMVGSCGDTGL